MKIALLLAEGFEELEAVGLIDLFRRAGYEVTVFSVTGRKPVKGGHGIVIEADALWDRNIASRADILVLPGGGAGVNNLAAVPEVLDLIRTFHMKGKYIAAICAGPFLLEKAGVLSGARITIFPTWKDRILSAAVLDQPVVVDGKIMTGQGAGAVIPFGLRVIEEISGKAEADKLAHSIVYRN
jgi:protein deglycase